MSDGWAWSELWFEGGGWACCKNHHRHRPKNPGLVRAPPIQQPRGPVRQEGGGRGRTATRVARHTTPHKKPRTAGGLSPPGGPLTVVSTPISFSRCGSGCGDTASAGAGRGWLMVRWWWCISCGVCSAAREGKEGVVVGRPGPKSGCIVELPGRNPRVPMQDGPTQGGGSGEAAHREEDGKEGGLCAITPGPGWTRSGPPPPL